MIDIQTLHKKIADLSKEEVVELLKNPVKMMDKEEALKIKNEEWSGEKYGLLGKLGNELRLYSKSNTIPITDFYRIHKDDCWIDGDMNKTVEKYINKIWEREEDKELYCRIILDYFDIIKNYLSQDVKSDYYDIPKQKRKYNSIPLSTRKNSPYNFERKYKDDIGEISKFVFKNLDILKSITLEDIIKWTEYMMLWGTYDGFEAEYKLMDFLKTNIPEINWSWASKEEDTAGVDIKGIVDEKEIYIQVKLTRAASIGDRGVDASQIITIFCQIENGKFFIPPKDFGNKGWIAYFLKFYCGAKGIDYGDYIKQRSLKF